MAIWYVALYGRPYPVTASMRFSSPFAISPPDAPGYIWPRREPSGSRKGRSSRNPRAQYSRPLQNP
eukprot:11211476-Lingulodinium_polyedra.AAC.1